MATTRNLGAIHPFGTSQPLHQAGIVLGRDLFGTEFRYDGFDLYEAGVLTNPNLVIFGQIGRGKSALVKCYLARQLARGRRAWVVDPKGEYAPLARAFGCVPLQLAPGGALRLNPLDARMEHVASAGPGVVGAGLVGPGRRRSGVAGAGRRGPGVVGAGGHGPARSHLREPRAGAPHRLVARRSELLAALAAAALGRALVPSERAALDAALHAAIDRALKLGRQPVLRDVLEALLAPEPDAARRLGAAPARLAEEGRAVALELRRLVVGDLAGMFDGVTTPGLRLDAPLVVVDLSHVHGTPALPVVMACVASWAQGVLGSNGGARSVLVVDEAWAVLRDPIVARFLQACFKLSRALGLANLVVLHRVSDLASVGPSGSEQVAIAEGLLADAETRVFYAQSPGELDALQRIGGLHDELAGLVAALPRGVGLWRVASRLFLVRHELAAGELAIVDTDAAIRRDAVALYPSGAR